MKNLKGSKTKNQERGIRRVSMSPPCSHWPGCEGCPLIGTPYPRQLEIKFERVRSSFLNAGFDPGLIDPILKKTRPSPLTLGYRNKAKWILDKDSKGNIVMGMYKPGTHQVINMPNCAVHAPVINEFSSYIRQKLEENSVPVGPHLNPHEPALRYLIVRYSFREKKLLVVFVSTAAKVPGLDRVIQSIDENEIWKKQVVSIVQNINADQGNVLLGEANKFFKRAGELTETMGPFRVPVGPLSFLQVNSLQANFLYKRVKEILGKGPFEAGLDLYSGVGLMAMHMASTTKRILAVEEVGPAALEAITAARRNRVGNILELCGDALEGIQTFVNEWGTPGWVILNPPRKGCDERILTALAQKPPKKLVYVSCNPQTLARDLGLLLNENRGFILKSIEPVDMFPQTEHTECIAYLEFSGGLKFSKAQTTKEAKDNKTSISRVKNRSKSVH